MTNPVAARDLATQLFEVEAAVGAALAKAALLTEAMVLSQKEFNLSATVGHRALDGVGAAISALTTANSEIATVHRRLDEIRSRVGIDPAVAYGGGDKPPIRGAGRTDDDPLTPTAVIEQAI